MGITTTLIAIGFLAIVAIIAFSFFNESFTNITDRAKGIIQAQNVEPQQQSGQIYCDLAIKIKAELREDLFKGLYVNIDKNNAKEYQWYCDFSPSLATLVNYDLEPLAFFLGGEKIHVELVLRDKSDSTFKYDANNLKYSAMYREITLAETTGIVPTPIDVGKEFYIEDVLHDDYTLEIYYGRIINEQTAGTPLVTDVCMVGKSSC